MKKLKLNNANAHTLVDDMDFDFLNQWYWNLDSSGYAQRNIMHKSKHTVLRMHTALLGKIDGVEVDHIDGNKLNNQKGNLRFATREENSRNTKASDFSNPKYKKYSQYKGVSTVSKRAGKTIKYRAYIIHEGRQKFLGNYGTEEEAALAYNAEAKKLWGEYAKLNDIKTKTRGKRQSN